MDIVNNSSESVLCFSVLLISFARRLRTEHTYVVDYSQSQALSTGTCSLFGDLCVCWQTAKFQRSRDYRSTGQQDRNLQLVLFINIRPVH